MLYSQWMCVDNIRKNNLQFILALSVVIECYTSVRFTRRVGKKPQVKSTLIILNVVFEFKLDLFKDNKKTAVHIRNSYL